ncbi:MAG TPA: STAS domain-containing protein [Gemmataceae bacterium]|nr:STAS domain-containing protein [Gemmataceae bacterium]
MPPPAGEPWFEIQQVGEVTVVRFTRALARFLEEETIKQIAERLFSLIGEEGRRFLVLNLANIERLDSLMLGKLVSLHKRTLTAGGRLALCKLRPELYEVFQTLGLTGFLWVYGEEHDALQSF